MRKLTKGIAMLLAMVLMFSLIGCDKKTSSKKESSQKEETHKTDVTPYIGTWQGSDHDGENIVHYLVFDQEGYWYVRMDYAKLCRAMEQLPDRYVSFKVMFEKDPPHNNSDHTGCYYEYVLYGDDEFSWDDEKRLVYKLMENVAFTKISEQSGTPDKIVVEKDVVTIRDQAKKVVERAVEPLEE